MKSSSGKYYIGLDHVRAVAIFIVFTWHFIQMGKHQYAPPPMFPFSLLTEGHTGVALFMTLSGYLFAKLLEEKRILYFDFLWNRFLRLVPLLVFVLLVVGVHRYLSGVDIVAYMKSVAAGIIKPTLPSGAWSITVEFHFYLMLPFLLIISRKWKYSLILVLLAAIFLRCFLHQMLGQIQILSYWTIVGHIDQFLFGIMAYQYKDRISGKHFLAATVITLFALFYWYFDLLGGFFKNTSYPSPTTIWIYMPTIEGFAYALAIAWYDNSFKHSEGKISRFIALIGTYSYSIYLFHFFVVFKMARAVNNYIADIANVYVALVFSAVCFFLMIPVGYMSFRFIESPFLKLRTRYFIDEKQILQGQETQK